MPDRRVDGKPTLGANAISGVPAILRTAVSLSPETPDNPSTNAASRQRTVTASAATSAIRGNETSRQLQTCSIDRHLENRAMQRLRIGLARDLERLGREYRPALEDLFDALIPLHRFEPHGVGNHQEWPEDLLLGPPQLADLAAYALCPALTFPD